ncbi:electron transfer flavoprotein alpha subunit [Guyanagaster necrorhizus]|uniref:Probable electron transfer flavoprotein subunit alpha n=1 Tax=Guyanagaster necrorhizus TaxID=856835 RepID=A0A9P7VUG3_9AGAR|nr:electron transfer flavoprotein alpha subunit [Guyanagaster necrorhizus MCA 3950]KAG7446324.1 electron transfer flavoprotein alpha subunit [Guyanagaster necrorhizus MCA 3950]
MLRLGAVRCACRPLVRAYATPASPHALVLLEHRAGVLDSGSLSALTAATHLGGQVTGLIISGPEGASVVDKAKKLKGLTGLLHSTSELYSAPVPEAVSPLLTAVLGSTPYTHVVSATSSFAKSLLPRVAAQLDVPAVSDITSLEHDAASNNTTFTRPIYAGNAIATVKASSSIPIKFFTVRGTSFIAAPSDDNASVDVQEVDPIVVSDSPTEHVKTSLTKSDRPDLGVASRVVSGGRPLKNAETFQATLYPLADVLGAAVGASRAAVDAGYADNSLQVGQTGKVVAPKLYMAFGISGAIQHLAGMKDSKLIVAVNKDPDAPIFQVADVGLVADLYEVIPQLVEKLKQ